MRKKKKGREENIKKTVGRERRGHKENSGRERKDMKKTLKS